MSCSKTQLSAYQYVQECCKYEQDVRLELLHKSQVDHSLQRTVSTRKDFESLETSRLRKLCPVYRMMH